MKREKKAHTINESFWILIFLCVVAHFFCFFSRLQLVLWGKKFIVDAHKIHFRMRLTLTFHNIQINIHIYHDVFLHSPSLSLSLSLLLLLSVVSLRVFFLHSELCYTAVLVSAWRSLALEKYTTFSCNLHSFSLVIFFSHCHRLRCRLRSSSSSSSSSYSYSRGMSIKFTPVHSLSLSLSHSTIIIITFIAHEFAMYTWTGAAQAQDDMNSTFFVRCKVKIKFHARENHCACCTTHNINVCLTVRIKWRKENYARVKMEACSGFFLFTRLTVSNILSRLQTKSKREREKKRHRHKIWWKTKRIFHSCYSFISLCVCMTLHYHAINER